MNKINDKRKLGRTNMYVNPIGLGGIPIQRCNQEEATKIINLCLDMGVNFIDSAKGYTCSEQYIGNAISGRRDEVFLATKSFSRTYEDMKKDLDSSLVNFQTDHIDLYQFHNVKSEEEFLKVIGENGAYQALREAKDKGIVCHIGITSHSYDFLNWLLDSEYNSYIDTIQFPYNFLEEDAKKLFSKAKKLNIGTIAMKPLGGGTIEKAEVALKYLLNDNNLSICIPGMGSISDVKTNLTIKTLDFNDDEIAYIQKLKAELKNEFCHRCGYCLPCTKGIDIPGTFTLEKYYLQYGLQDWANKRYFGAKVLPSECINCGKCLPRCPYSLNIPEKLKKIVQIFEKTK